MALPFLQFEQLTVQRNQVNMLDGIDLVMNADEHWAVTGASGSGKTTLALVLAGRQHYSGRILVDGRSERLPTVSLVEQQHHFKKLSNTTDFYYQQRYNASDAADTITVGEALGIPAQMENGAPSGIAIDQLSSLLHIDHLLNEPLIQLSNGENKRLQIAKALMTDPRLLILDNPFVGLDAEGRDILSGIITRLCNTGRQILLITSPREIPDSITHIATLNNGKLISTAPRIAYTPPHAEESAGSGIDYVVLRSIPQLAEPDFKLAVKMINVTVKYNDRTILNSLNWEVKKGEHWSISGPNGAGKSTLLSLIAGDNTKAYANEIYLFDKRRGSGESIWDIKQKIGYVSPEMHLYFDYSSTCFETVASGLFDSIGLFRTLNPVQTETVNRWLAVFKLEKLGKKRLSLLSTGEQRLVLLARALVKNPPLLILDEPCQGLDGSHVQLFKQMINDICGLFDTTLLYVSHYTEEIPECITHFMRIYEGNATFSTTPATRSLQQ